MKRLHIFKPGRHIADDGVAYTFSEADLKATAAAYDPAKHEAPLVIGHPKTDDPAYGWTKSLAFSDGLEAEPDQVDPAFAEMVGAGRFKKISPSFYAPDAPNNPAPGVYSLRHIGFLGARPPAVKGLRNASFADGEQGVIEFGDWSDSSVASLFRAIRDFFIEKFGKDAADKVLPDYSITALTERAAQDNTMKSTSYSEHDMETAEQRAAREAKEAKLKTDQEALEEQRVAQAAKDLEFAEREKALKSAEAAQRRAGIATFVEGLVKEGKVLPVCKDGLVSYLVGPNDAGVIEFGEGDKKVSRKPDEWLREYLKAQPKIVEFKEIAAGAAADVDLTDPKKIAAKALEFKESEQKAGRTISITEAVQHITGGNK